MATKKRRNASAPPPSEPIFNQSFGNLASLRPSLESKKIQENKGKKIIEKPTPPPPPPPPPDDTLFLSEMADVTPLDADVRRPKLSPPTKVWAPPEMPNEDLEVLRNLSQLVADKTEVNLTHSDEYLEGQVTGFPSSLMAQLRSGYIPFQDSLDLHNLTVMQAEAAVTRFILDSVANGRRCVLLIHGKGLGSQDGVGVLKRNLEAFLLGGPGRKYIMAFTAACPVDGGLGASYILLRS